MFYAESSLEWLTTTPGTFLHIHTCWTMVLTRIETLLSERFFMRPGSYEAPSFASHKANSLPSVS